MDDVIGQPLRKLHGNSTRQALFWNPKGKEGKQGLKNNWRKSAKQELRQIGSQWNETELKTQDRDEWRRTSVDALCYIEEWRAQEKRLFVVALLSWSGNPASHSSTLITCGKGGGKWNPAVYLTLPWKKPGLFNPTIMFFLDLIGGIITSYIESSRLVSLNLIQGRVGVQLPPGYYRGVSQGFIHAPLSVFFFL